MQEACEAGRDVLSRAETLFRAFDELASRDPQREALVLVAADGTEEAVTLERVRERAGQVHAALAQRDVAPGSAVVLILPTGLELIAAYLGALSAGAAPVLLATPSHRVADPKVFRLRVDHVLAAARPAVIACEREVSALLPQPRHSPCSVLLPSEVSAETAMPRPHAARPGDVATIQFSSGTTGRPKGVLVTHRAVLNNLRAMRQAFRVQPGDVAVNWIPLYHDMGLFGAFLLPLLSGCRTVLIPTHEFLRSPSLWLQALHRQRGTFAWGPNMSFALCAGRIPDGEIEGLDLSCWRLALNGSEPVLSSTVRSFAERFAPLGLRAEAMSPAWGLAETTVLATVHPPEEAPRTETLDRMRLVRDELAIPSERAGVSCVSVGRCIPGAEVEIRGSRGERLADRQVGEIWLRSDALFSGYLGDPAATVAALTDGWLRTGDRGYLVDGYLFFVARSKDLIVVGGEKHLPDDVESIINRVPGVRQGCAVAFGVLNDERGTEDLAAVVESRETNPERVEDLERRIRKEVARTLGLGLRHLLVTGPGGVEKTTSGKLSRSGTRDRYRDAFRGDS